MSASVASSAVGLLDRHYSPPAIANNDATRWPEMMDLDHQHQQTSSRNQSEITERDPSQSAEIEQNNGLYRKTEVQQADHDRQDAIGGLLAALATNGGKAISQATTDQNQPIRRSMTPPVDSPISQTSQNEFATVKEEGAIQESNDARLPDDNTKIDYTTQMSMNGHPSQSIIDQLESAPFSAEDLASLPFPPLDMTMSELPPDLQDEIPINVKRQIDAYARLEFADGTFYLNTYQCELGRDQHAYRDALQRDREAKEAQEQGKTLQKSSSGKASQRSLQIKAESQVQGSVVSEAGGFAGVDDQPVSSHSDKKDGKHHSSQASETSIVRPSDVLHNPSLLPYDYHKDVVYQPQLLAPVPENDLIEDEQPAPVTSEHLPDPSSCPLIPIHATLASDQTEAESLKAISRRHIRISWNSKYSVFFMHVLGRNGAFFEESHMKRGESVRLYTGARIQISAVDFIFRLPDVVDKKLEEDEEEEDGSIESDEGSESPLSAGHTTATNGHPIKLKLKLNTETSTSQAAGPNGELKRRGPGRPPKNGIMSQREMKEREKAEKEAKARSVPSAASPPAVQRKFSKSQLPNPEPSPVTDPAKVEKRKYTKRKREDGEDDEVLPSIEAQEETPVVENPPPPPPQPVAKRARTKSFSPEYKPQDQCTPEDLARPPHNYAVLLYMVLSETGEITLRQIYKQMQSRWPYFKYVVDSDGWTSSVRHNLNQEVGKLFERGRKEGKGFTWLPKPNAMEEYQAQKNKRSNAPPVPKPRAPPQRPNYTGPPGQQLTWQNNVAAREPQQPGGTYPHQGPWGPQPSGSKPNQMPNGHPTGQRPMPGQPPNMPINRDPNYIPPTHLLPQHFGRPAPRFMPVTFEGLAVIARFEQSMFQNLRQDEATQVKWRQIFASAKGRCLHGNEKSTLEGGETAEEATIVKHISDFVTRYKNPAFEGFKARQTESPSLTGPNLPVNQGPTPTGGPTMPSQPATPTQVSTPQNNGPVTAPISAPNQPSQTQVLAIAGNDNVTASSVVPSQTTLPTQAPATNHPGYPPPLPQLSAPNAPAQAQSSIGSAGTMSATAFNHSYPPLTVPAQSTTPASVPLLTSTSAGPSVPPPPADSSTVSLSNIPAQTTATSAISAAKPATSAPGIEPKSPNSSTSNQTVTLPNTNNISVPTASPLPKSDSVGSMAIVASKVEPSDSEKSPTESGKAASAQPELSPVDAEPQ